MNMIIANNNPAFLFLLNNIRKYITVNPANNKYNGLTFASVLSSSLNIDLNDSLALIANQPISNDIYIPSDTSTLFDYCVSNLKNVLSNVQHMQPHDLNSDLALNAFNCSATLSVMFMKQPEDCVYSFIK